MKKLFSILLILVSLLSLIPKNIDASDSWYFIVTAYYSPLPDQKYYITGNYESEKRLNGNGIAWASGKKVFSGMLAAPWKYKFWTKIELKGLWVGSVEDRGGAIVPAWKRGYSHDRIDVWVGYGDEWLRRAMYWGKRKIAGKVVRSTTQTTLDYNSIPSPSWAVPKTTTLYGKKVQVAQTQKAKDLDIFSRSLGRSSSVEDVQELQEILNKLSYYNSNTYTWKYDSDTIDAVYNFQVNNWVVSSVSTPGAGSYGPKTRKKLQEVYTLYLDEEKKKQDFLIEFKKMEDQSLIQAQERIQAIWIPSYWDISPEVRELQRILTEVWVFDYKDTAIFWTKTANSLISLQLSNKLVESASSPGAWTFGPATRVLTWEKLAEIILQNKIEESWLHDDYNRYIVTPDNSDVSIQIGSLAKNI